MIDSTRMLMQTIVPESVKRFDSRRPWPESVRPLPTNKSTVTSFVSPAMFHHSHVVVTHICVYTYTCIYIYID